jgi:hypothetical protein
MNFNAIMPYVILFGILAFIVVLRLARGGFGGGTNRSPVAGKLAIVWLVIVLGMFLFLVLYGQRIKQSKASPSEQPETSSGAVSTVQTNH